MWRTIFLLAWIPLLWHPLWGQSPSVGVKKAIIEPPDGRKGSDPKKWADERGSKERPFVVDTEGHQQSDQERTQSDTKEQRAREVERWTLYFAQLSAWATGALVLIGFGGVVAAIVTLLAIKRQADLQERAIRPWIGTDFIPPGTVLEISGRLEITANISLKNTGPSVALDGIMLPHLISSRTAALPSDIKDAWIRTETQLTARNGTEWETGFVLYPTRSHTHESVMGGSMPYSDMEARLCYVLVCVIYRDQFGKEHRTQDCFNIRTQGPDVPPNGIAFTAVPAHQKAT